MHILQVVTAGTLALSSTTGYHSPKAMSHQPSPAISVAFQDNLSQSIPQRYAQRPATIRVRELGETRAPFSSDAVATRRAPGSNDGANRARKPVVVNTTAFESSGVSSSAAGRKIVVPPESE